MLFSFLFVVCIGCHSCCRPLLLSVFFQFGWNRCLLQFLPHRWLLVVLNVYRKTAFWLGDGSGTCFFFILTCIIGMGSSNFVVNVLVLVRVDALVGGGVLFVSLFLLVLLFPPPMKWLTLPNPKWRVRGYRIVSHVVLVFLMFFFHVVVLLISWCSPARFCCCHLPFVPAVSHRWSLVPTRLCLSCSSFVALLLLYLAFCSCQFSYTASVSTNMGCHGVLFV